MRIPCPLCGARPLEEFVYRGDATVTRPEEGAPMEEWVSYVYLRNNPKGAHREHWRHVAGCGSWLIVDRNTLTHEITRVAEVRPSGDAR
ncbi:sarcosine oxidase subunit delta [Nitratireductor sp. XY-223]|uniref:sarcosine oxidase subunit delta n=1 Tax=Nitratireductor sp. XY-223 TaxID=2561926 RepID=UPI0010A9CA1B|nr:sarcosine oxidase subunit delta [Nitratireductor sp. XY-223]